MSSRFLYSSPALDLTVLQDGTFNLNVATAKVSELTPNKGVFTDAENKLISGNAMANPLTSDLSIGAFDITGLPFGQTLKGINSQQIFQPNVIDATESKTQNITSAVPDITNMGGLLRIPEVSLERLSSTLQSSYIDMSEGGINITSGSLSFNGASIATKTALTANSVPYINSTGALSSSITNLYAQSGVNTIQSVLSTLTTGNGYSLQLSAGVFTETSLTLSLNNILLSGAQCPVFAPTTLVNTNLRDIYNSYKHPYKS